jgi:putative endonuclease
VSEGEGAAISALLMSKQSYVYIMTNKDNRVLYTGVTSDLIKRVYQHRKGEIRGFTQQYKIKKLVFYEVHGDIYNAITREKQIKAGSREKKEELINSMNPDWHDLYDDLT